MSGMTIDKAEQVIENIDKKRVKISYTKLRDFLSMVNTLQSQLKQEERPLNENERDQLDRFLIQFIYESGRSPEVKEFVEQAGLIKSLKGLETTKDFLKFHHYMEALVAYHKFHIKEKR